jgi:hypothetical protein
MPDCFIIMPLTTPDLYLPTYGGDKDHFHHVLDHLFKPALVRAGFNPIPPIAEGSDVIHAEIIKNLEKADLVLCDMSILNANVFFELGIRTALDKAVCLVRDDVTTKVPFDLTMVNYLTYSGLLAPWTLEKQVQNLSEHIQKSTSRSNGQNMLWKYFGLSTRAAIPTPPEGREDRLELIEMQLQGISRKLEETLPPGRPLKHEFLITPHHSTVAWTAEAPSKQNELSKELLELLNKYEAENPRWQFIVSASEGTIKLTTTEPISESLLTKLGDQIGKYGFRFIIVLSDPYLVIRDQEAKL